MDKTPYTNSDSRDSSHLKENGRICCCCKRFKPWNLFDKKPSGRNGKDSRCKVCIARIKKKLRKKSNRIQKRSGIFCSVLVGCLNEESVEYIGAVLGNCIRELIDEGKL